MVKTTYKSSFVSMAPPRSLEAVWVLVFRGQTQDFWRIARDPSINSGQDFGRNTEVFRAKLTQRDTKKTSLNRKGKIQTAS